MRGRSERERVTRPLEAVTVSAKGTKSSTVRLVWLIGLLLLLLIYKPWDTGSKGSSLSAYLPALETPVVSPTPRATTELDVVAGFCLEPSGWRVYSSERWGGQTVRSWTAATPIRSATGPTDPRIPVIPVVSQAVLAIGFCAPVHGSDTPPADAVSELYSLTATTVDGGTVTHATAIAPLRAAPPGRPSYLGAAFAPLSGPSWSDGVYIVHIEGDAYARWFGILVETLQRPASS
jgi:hypothetical protein